LIHTERLVLRDLQRDDFEAVHAYATDPEVVRYMPWGPNTEAETEAFFDRVDAMKRADPRAGYELAVVRESDDRLLGAVGLHLDEREMSIAMLGYCYSRAAWGNGYATEAAFGLLRFGFEEWGLMRVWAGCDPDNAGSIRVLQKLGMSQEGRLRQDTLIDGEWRDTLIFGVLRDEWSAGSGVPREDGSGS